VTGPADLAFRAAPLAPARGLPRLAWPVHRRDVLAVGWRPRCGGGLDLAVVVETVEGQRVAEYVVGEPDDPRLAGLAGTPARVDPGGRRRLAVLDPAGLGQLVDRRSYRAGSTVAVADLPGFLGAASGGNWSSTRAGGFALVLAGRARPGSRGCRKYADTARIIVGPTGLARWESTPSSTPAGQRRYGRLRGPLVDALTAAAIYAGRGRFVALNDACQTWDLDPPEATGDPVEDLRREARAVGDLLLAVEDEARTWGVPSTLGDIATPGSLASRLLTAAGILPAGPRLDSGLPARLRAAGAQAFHGAIHSAGAIGVGLPVAHADISAAYPRVAAALGAGRYLVAGSVEPVDVTDQLRDLLDAPDLAERAVDSAVWRRFGVTLARVRPHGDLLPVRNHGWLRLAPLDLDGDTAWWAWPDLVAATLRAGRPPEVVEAVHLRPVGVVDGLARVRLPSGRWLDSARRDLFAQLVDERDRLGIARMPEAVRDRRVAAAKAVTNATYGLLARVDRERVGRRTTDRALGVDGAELVVRNGWRERPGPFCWLPLAATITAGCRLLVGSVIAAVEHRGGLVVHVAADALDLLATAGDTPEPVDVGAGATRLALPVDDLDAILARVDRLLDPTGKRSAFKREHGWDRPVRAVITGTNRIALVDDDGRAAKITSVGLGGQAADPAGLGVDDNGQWRWATELHTLWARHRLAGGDWPPPNLPEWASLPRVVHGRATSPDILTRIAGIFHDPDIRLGARYSTISDSLGARTLYALGHIDPADAYTTAWQEPGAGIVTLDNAAPFLDAFTAAPHTITDKLREWTRPGLRTGLVATDPIVSPLAAARIVGKDSDYLAASVNPDRTGAHPDNRRSVYGAAGDIAEALRRKSDECGILDSAMIAGIVGLPDRTVRAVLAGRRPSTTTIARITEAVADPARWPTLNRVRVCPLDRRHRWVGTLGTCPHCKTEQRTPTPVEGATCPECGTTFPGHVPAPCPACQRKENE